MTYEEFFLEKMKLLQTYDYVVMSNNSYIIRLNSRNKERVLEAMEKSMFFKEDSGEFLIKNEDTENFNLRMFAIPEKGLNSIEICCPSEISYVMKDHIDDLTKKFKKITLDEIFDKVVKDFIDCKIEIKTILNNPNPF